MLPTFIVIGAKKSGTTSLHRYLRAHPSVWLPPDKRLEFFTDVNWHRGSAWYAAQFDGAGAAEARGEITTSYTRAPLVQGVAARMQSVVPDVRLLYVVRDPVARTVSHYRYALTEGWETRSIDDALAADPAEYVAPSRYAFQLEPFLDRFDRSQLLVVPSEDLRDDRVATLARIYGFLGVAADFVPSDVDRTHHRGSDLRRAPDVVQRLRRSSTYRRMRPMLPARVRDRAWRASTRRPDFADDQFVLAPSTKAALLDVLRPDLERLRGIMGDAFHCWGYLDGP